MSHFTNAFENLENRMANMALTENDQETVDGSEATSAEHSGGVDFSSANSVAGAGAVVPSRYFEGRHPANGTSYAPYHRGGFQNFRNSRTWVSPENKHMQEFVIIRNAMRRLFKHSDVAKWKYGDYIAHKEAMVASQKAQLDRKLKVKEEDHQRRLSRTEEQEMNSRALAANVTRRLNISGNRALVLGEQTIWCVDWQNGKDEIAPWPTFAEMKWEGDDRAKTAVGRFLPLPREIGAPGITWSQLQVIEQYPLDQVQKIPTMEDIYLPVDEIDEELKYNFITKDLEEAMDASLEV
jgi:hypothetical protein